MTKVKLNEMLVGMSGKYGENHVYRNVQDGRTILSRLPKNSGNVSAGQTAHRERFGEAIKYAVFARDDQELWQKYVKRRTPGHSAFNMAVSDFMALPVIMNIDTAAYLGHPGEKIIVTAVDKFEVTGVTVRISGADGTLIEEGPATRRDETNYFVYIAAQENAGLTGTVVTAIVTDNPGHIVTASVTL